MAYHIKTVSGSVHSVYETVHYTKTYDTVETEGGAPTVEVSFHPLGLPPVVFRVPQDGEVVYIMKSDGDNLETIRQPKQPKPLKQKPRKVG